MPVLEGWVTFSIGLGLVESEVTTLKACLFGTVSDRGVGETYMGSRWRRRTPLLSSYPGFQGHAAHALLSCQDSTQVLEQAERVMVAPHVLWILSKEPWSVWVYKIVFRKVKWPSSLR